MNSFRDRDKILYYLATAVQCKKVVFGKSGGTQAGLGRPHVPKDI